MAFGYKVFGPCVPQVGTGVANAMEGLGVTTNGGHISLEVADAQIMSDAAGPKVPVEVQQMGALAYIDFDLTSWDEAILTKLLNAAEATATLGQAGVPGTLLGTGGFLKGLYLPSGLDAPWYFPTCKLMPNSGKYGTEATMRKLRFMALRWLAGTATTAAAQPLYTRAAPP